MDTLQKQNRTLIIITSGFEEVSTVVCLKQFRAAGLSVKLVGLTSRPVVGAHGLVVRPDCSLEELDGEHESGLMIIPGCEDNAKTLLADPRFHRLFQAMLANHGHVGIMRSAETAFGQAGLAELLSTPQCLRQGAMDAYKFCQGLADATFLVTAGHEAIPRG